MVEEPPVGGGSVLWMAAAMREALSRDIVQGARGVLSQVVRMELVYRLDDTSHPVGAVRLQFDLPCTSPDNGNPSRPPDSPAAEEPARVGGGHGELDTSLRRD